MKWRIFYFLQLGYPTESVPQLQSLHVQIDPSLRIFRIRSGIFSLNQL